MLKNFSSLLVRTELSCTTRRHLAASFVLREKWDLFTAVCLERKPVITPPLNQIETEYKKMLAEVEFERSLKSDHEVRHEKEVKQLEKAKSGNDAEVHLKETAQDIADAATAELEQFKFGSRVTEADHRNDAKSLNRKLDKHLVLVVKQKIGNQSFYMLPQRLREDGETLRQTAERVLKETCTNDVKALVYGNAPSSFYKYKYPQKVRNEQGTVGAKVFIYFARYQNGQLPGQGIDYKWLDRQELEKLLPKGYQESVSQMLIDE